MLAATVEFVYASSSYSELGYPFDNDSSIKNAYNTVIKRVLYEYLQQVADDSGEDPDDNPEPPKHYRMVVSKDFGNKLRSGAAARTVRAHIEECKDPGNGAVVGHKNEEMTRSIVPTGRQGLQVTSTAIRGGRLACTPAPWRRGRGRPPTPHAKTAWVPPLQHIPPQISYARRRQ